jgi:hypothetical protein
MFACYRYGQEVLGEMTRGTHLQSVGKSETSDTATSYDDFEIVCHD